MGLSRRRIGVLAGAGFLAVGSAALVVAAVGVFSGTPAAPSGTHQVARRHHDHDHRSAGAPRPTGEHARRHHGRRHPRLRVARVRHAPP